MSDRIFSFAKTKDGKNLLATYKKWFFIRENQIKEFLIAYNSYFMVQAAMQIKGMSKISRSVIEFMTSDEFSQLHDQITKTVHENYPMLMSCLTKAQKKKLEALLQ